MAASQLPEGRYGRGTLDGARRHAVPLGLLLAVLAGLAIAVVGYHNLGVPPIRTEVLGFTVLPGNTVQLRLIVYRDDPSRPAVCIVRARSLDGAETGRKELYVPPAAGPIVLSTVVLTSRPPVIAEVFGCSYQVPAYLDPAPNY